VDLDAMLDALANEGALLTAAVERADPDAAVPSCPEWAVRDLVHHTGGIHRWATRIVTEKAAEPSSFDLEDIAGGWPDDRDLAPWIRAGHALLLDALRHAPDDLECWSFLTSSPTSRSFWARRQLHETTIHRVDAELASGRVSPIVVEHAIDGIDELLGGFLPRRPRQLTSDAPTTIAVQPTDADGGWLVTAGPEGATTARAADADADVVVRGPAADLYLFVWNRRDATGLDVKGDASALDLWRSNVTIRWR
jgi:uncharacterized protein (TIGR03083 family)